CNIEGTGEPDGWTCWFCVSRRRGRAFLAKLRPGNPPQVEKAKQLFIEKFFDDTEVILKFSSITAVSCAKYELFISI
ncbi:MAG: hypothetical protein RLO12_23550, partial [Fulvivirga sp.]